MLDRVMRSLPANAIVTCAGDVANAADSQRMVDTALKFNGTLDVLVNNAAIGIPGSLIDLSLEDWQSMLDINLTGPFLLMKAALPHMIKAGKGSIINISSLAGLRGAPGTPAYAAAKAGLNMLSQQVAVEYGPAKIRCNVVCPGAIRTPQMDEIMERFTGALDMENPNVEDVYTAFSVNTPLRRVGNPDEITGICNFLASDDSSFVTGAVIAVDGGTAVVDANGLALFNAMKKP
jgi:NAD(P)-dependent dehydrogenase (short-subunit alcohol dehydrogenase family)